MSWKDILYSNYESDLEKFSEVLLGKDIYPWVEKKLAKKAAAQSNFSWTKNRARTMNMRLSDYIIDKYTTKIPNTKLGRKIWKGKLIKEYTEDDPCLRIMK